MRDARRARPSLWIVALLVLLSVAGHAEQFPAPPPPPPPPPPSSSLFEAAPADALPAGTGTGLIFGRVVDAVTGRPLGGVLVRIGGAPTSPIAPPPAATAPPAAMTNAQGQFLFRNLPAGRFPLTAHSGGYVPGSYGQSRPEGPAGSVLLGDAERVTDVTIRMWRYAAITGRVLDEDGVPAVGLPVRVLRRSVVGRQNQWTVIASANQTDDRGIYRVALLPPGEYIVSTTAGLATVPTSVGEAYVQAMQSGAQATVPPAIQEASTSPLGAGARLGDLQVQPLRSPMPPPAALEAGLSYATVYHPSATRIADATRVRVGAGEEKGGVDVQQRLVKTFRVRGLVLGPDGQPMSAGVTLLPSDARDLSTDYNFETAAAVSDADGRFTFMGVPPGQYVIRMLRVPRPTGSPGVVTMVTTGGGGISFFSSGIGAEGPPPPPPDEPTLWAEVPVSVAEHVDDVSVGVRPGARVGGTVVFEGPGTPLEPPQRRQMFFSLVPVSGRMGGPRQPAPGRFVDEDSFVTSQYPPGKYFVNVGGVSAPWSARSVSVGGRNALEEPLDLGASDINGLVITLSSLRTELTGTVRDAAGARPTATVLIFPADHEAWIANGMRTTRARSVATGAGGSFQISGLLPGRYLAVAVAPGVAADVQNAAMVEGLAPAGVPVTLAEGAPQSVSLTVTSAP